MGRTRHGRGSPGAFLTDSSILGNFDRGDSIAFARLACLWHGLPGRDTVSRNGMTTEDGKASESKGKVEWLGFATGALHGNVGSLFFWYRYHFLLA